MEQGDLAILFSLQNQLTNLRRIIDPKREHIYESFPEVIDVFPASDDFEQDENENALIREGILRTCRIRVEVMECSPDLREKLETLFPGIPVEIVEADMEREKQGLSRLLARHSDRLSDAIDGGYYIAVDLDKMGACFNIGLNQDTPENRQKIRDIFPGERIVFLKNSPRLSLKPG